MQFDAYFKESVDESPLENHRVRKCKVLVYLEDSSLQIDECRQENSGMPQGTLVKRHQIPYPEVKYTKINCQLTLYCSCTASYTIVACIILVRVVCMCLEGETKAETRAKYDF